PTPTARRSSRRTPRSAAASTTPASRSVTSSNSSSASVATVGRRPSATTRPSSATTAAPSLVPPTSRASTAAMGTDGTGPPGSLPAPATPPSNGPRWQNRAHMTTMDPTTTPAGPGRSFSAMFDSICSNIAVAVRGKDDVIRLTVTCLVAGGHLLIEDVPGVGKTTIAKALARSVDGRFGRVQFTPDLLPSDVLGSSVWNQSSGAFEFRAGPVFHHLVLSDEINRASPKTQSALLEAMAEEQVTVDGTTYPLPRPFMVVATQNPLEHQGTFPLPESQLDRFLMRLSVGYPDRVAETALLTETDHDDRLAGLGPVVSTDDVLAMGAAAAGVFVSDALAAYLVELA